LWNPLRPNRRPTLHRQRLRSGWIQSACSESILFRRNVVVRSNPPRFRIYFCFWIQLDPFFRPQLPPILLKVSYRCGAPDVMDVFCSKRNFFFRLDPPSDDFTQRTLRFCDEDNFKFGVSSAQHAAQSFFLCGLTEFLSISLLLFVFTWRFTRTDAPQHFRRALQTPFSSSDPQ
jgi:hypothetical protein